MPGSISKQHKKKAKNLYFCVEDVSVAQTLTHRTCRVVHKRHSRWHRCKGPSPTFYGPHPHSRSHPSVACMITTSRSKESAVSTLCSLLQLTLFLAGPTHVQQKPFSWKDWVLLLFFFPIQFVFRLMCPTWVIPKHSTSGGTLCNKNLGITVLFSRGGRSVYDIPIVMIYVNFFDVQRDQRDQGSVQSRLGV